VRTECSGSFFATAAPMRRAASVIHVTRVNVNIANSAGRIWHETA